VIILPILKELGWNDENIVRSKSLEHPYLKIGSKRRAVTLIPDYAFVLQNCYAWVLDAKSPNQEIASGDNVEQVYSYAAHPEIRSAYFALCNGISFSVFRTGGTGEPILYFALEEISDYLEALKKLLSVNSFKNSENIIYDRVIISQKRNETFDYGNRPLLEEIEVKKRKARRHCGVHGYFTRQAWNVVAEYIKNFSQKGDVVLDSFGGSGVTAVEALMNGRKAINIDINPLAVFMVNSLTASINLNELEKAFQNVCEEYKKKEPKNKAEIKEVLKNYPLPKDLKLPKSSDVDSVHKLYSDEQMAKLALLKAIIKREKKDNIRNTLLLMFSGIIGRANITWYSVGGEFGGGESVFRYFRYRKAPQPSKLNIIKYFEVRYKKILAAKKEIEGQCRLNKMSVEEANENLKNIKGTATNLSFLKNESIDYIYTDPPYGKKIPYLDLSVMWNAWLDFDVSKEDYELEAIEGGEHNKSKQSYRNLITKSIEEMFRVLKFDRWMSFVFAHKDPEFWHLIIDTCEKCGFEYIGAVPQKNGQTSFKKRQHPFTVLSGELIINFRKVRNPIAILKANLGMSIGEIVIQTIEGVIAKNDGATLEQINDELIIKGLELGFLDLLKKEYSDLTPILTNNFDYDVKTEKYSIKKDAKFQTRIDVKLRIKYYLISYLRRMERENKKPSFDEIVMNIMPLLKNGVTPEAQTILSVLEDIADKTEDDRWKLKTEKQQLSMDFS
ncbi:MAG: DNA methylase, partial [Chitinivibrionia bacterium]|nr:DNA methylase [Chitinivibrionia bacterium]